TRDDLAKVQQELDALKEPFLRVCQALLDVLPDGPGPNNAYLQARAACAGESLGPGNEPTLNQLFALRAVAALNRAQADPNARGDVATTRKELQDSLDQLAAFTTPTVDACHYNPNDPTDTEKITRAYLAAAFDHPQVRYGVGTTFEFDAFRWGFSTDDK